MEVDMPEVFSAYRIHSRTRPDVNVGLIHGYAGVGKCFPRSALEALTSDRLGFYRENYLMTIRGPESASEEYVLQGEAKGVWTDIKAIAPLPGRNPKEDDFGKCVGCGTDLEESEFALGVRCQSCITKIQDAREAATW